MAGDRKARPCRAIGVGTACALFEDNPGVWIFNVPDLAATCGNPVLEVFRFHTVPAPGLQNCRRANRGDAVWVPGEFFIHAEGNRERATTATVSFSRSHGVVGPVVLFKCNTRRESAVPGRHTASARTPLCAVSGSRLCQLQILPAFPRAVIPADSRQKSRQTQGSDF